MKYLGTIKVVPDLPEEIERLKELAYNLYFSWNPEARQLFRQIDPELWKRSNHNPVKFLQEVPQKSLERVAKDPQYLALFKKVFVEFDQYMNPPSTWFTDHFPDEVDKLIAYFSAEVGLHESLPIYAGGLGVLAGDHIKSASDLGIPLVAVSLFYTQTYFTQKIDVHGNQIAEYIPLNPEELPMHPVLDEQGNLLVIDIPIAQRTVKARIWKVQVGRIPVFLLDTNVEGNSPADREITFRLYGGDQEMRISQEIVLGMGGVMALNAMGIRPYAWHMNEGHSVFLALERIRNLVREKGLKFYEALEAVASNTIFTTHTPVPAGNDAFPLHIKDKYFQSYWEDVQIRRHQFMELGSQIQPQGYEIFNLTILSLKLSRFRNAVSKLHGEVSRRLWKDVWPDLLPEEVPITHITNGVHPFTWTTLKMRELFDKYLGREWRERVDDPNFWKAVLEIPDEALWEVKMALKEKTLNHVRERLIEQYTRNKVGTLQIRRLKQMLKPEVLTIGFARRFATYKRGTLIFRDPERLKKILNDPERPVQFIFAGKAHPLDQQGQALIQTIYQYAMQEGFRGRIFFVEGYDMHLGRDLTSGVDVWLNNPRRPQEASGTSGQKVGMNAGINFSVLDGWWNEAYNGKNGWAFGDQEDYHSLDELDTWDSEAIYDILENDIVPLYYQRNAKGIPEGWVQVMKQSLLSIMPQYNTHRMLKEYLEKLYLPAIENGIKFSENDFALARGLAQWKEKVDQHWSQIQLKADGKLPHDETIVLKYKTPFKLEAVVALDGLTPDDVKVQVFLFNDSNLKTDQKRLEWFDMKQIKKLEGNQYLYQATIVPENSGHYHYTLRVIPSHPALVTENELGKALWYRS